MHRLGEDAGLVAVELEMLPPVEALAAVLAGVKVDS